MFKSNPPDKNNMKCYDRKGKRIFVGDFVLVHDKYDNSNFGFIHSIRHCTITVWNKNQRTWTGLPFWVEKLSDDKAMLWKLENE